MSALHIILATLPFFRLPKFIKIVGNLTKF